MQLLKHLQALGYGRLSSLSILSTTKKLQAPSYGGGPKPNRLLQAASSSTSAQPSELLDLPPSSSSSSSSSSIATLSSYHDLTKHSFHRYADGPDGLDWASQPISFRRYNGAPVVPLRHLPALKGSSCDPHYPRVFSEFVHPCIVSKASISQLLYDSLAISAWKTIGSSTWSLRVNPSSGNLHPTEGYIISGPVAGLSESPFVAHYAPQEHALEIRAEISFDLWRDMCRGLPEGTIFVGLTSILWREAWKYGERAFRYCNHDVGHAIGAVSMAASSLGWDSLLLDGWGNEELEQLLGVAGYKEVEVGTGGSVKGHFPELEHEHADCLLAVFPGKPGHDTPIVRKRPSFPRRDPVPTPAAVTAWREPIPSEALASSIASRMSGVEWKGEPNTLSKDHVRWDIIYKAAAASLKPTIPTKVSARLLPQWVAFTQTYLPFSVRQVIHNRRSAVSMETNFSIQRETFYQIMWKAMPSGFGSESQGDQQQLPFRVLPWRAELHMAIFVHRVIDLPRGLYFLVRNSEHEQSLRESMRPEFEWVKPEKCPAGLPLYRLAEADCRKLSSQLSCHQDIAGDSCFSLGMVARFDSAIHERGAWMYPRLFWESGVLGQLLYLEAHAIGISATGIGCYFDDAVHQVLGLKGTEFQSLYHFTVGAPVEDKRIMSLPAYPGPSMDAI